MKELIADSIIRTQLVFIILSLICLGWSIRGFNLSKASLIYNRTRSLFLMIISITSLLVACHRLGTRAFLISKAQPANLSSHIQPGTDDIVELREYKILSSTSSSSRKESRTDER